MAIFVCFSLVKKILNQIVNEITKIVSNNTSQIYQGRLGKLKFIIFNPNFFCDTFHFTTPASLTPAKSLSTQQLQQIGRSPGSLSRRGRSALPNQHASQP